MSSPNPGELPQQPTNPNEKTLHVWSKPVEEPQVDQNVFNKKPAVGEAVSMIKSDDFANVHNTPCARRGFLTGIASGFGIGGVRFLTTGNITRSANWAVGFFVLGSVASYEYCQYQRRTEKVQMKRHIEVVNEGRKEQQRKFVEAKKEQIRIAEEKKAAEKSWYKVW